MRWDRQTHNGSSSRPSNPMSEGPPTIHGCSVSCWSYGWLWGRGSPLCRPLQRCMLSSAGFLMSPWVSAFIRQQLLRGQPTCPIQQPRHIPADAHPRRWMLHQPNLHFPEPNLWFNGRQALHQQRLMGNSWEYFPPFIFEAPQER